MSANICILDDPSRLDQHIAQSSVVVVRQEVVEIKVEEVTVRKLMRTRTRKLEGIQNVYVIVVTRKQKKTESSSVVEAIYTCKQILTRLG
jgi:hypothetical protein